MAEEKFSSPRVAPGRPKGSGSKAPWIVLVLIITAALAFLASAGVALIILRG